MASYAVRERDGSGRVIAVYSSGGGPATTENGTANPKAGNRRSNWRRVLSDVFLPEGYPSTVSSDYLQYQVWNALQAFCSSLASLFASRAVLQGHGVGNASASATNAIFLTVLQDVFSRLTTIVAGYYLGTSLYPEAKTYRLLADILNDAAIICDTLSPHLAHISISFAYPFFAPASDSSLRIVALCMSGAFRSLCGAVAGGSKAALTVHFATAGERPGDVGDLSAKDGSKETVLALLGMLCGSVVLHYVHSARTTYLVLFGLIFCHLAANVIAVRVIAMRTFNRQRASIAWNSFRASFDEDGNGTGKSRVPDYVAVSRREYIFPNPAWISSPSHGCTANAHCALGVPFSTISGSTLRSKGVWSIFASTEPGTPHRMTNEQVATCLKLFADEKYILWYAAHSASTARSTPPSLAIVLKDGHSPHDHLKAWAHAHEVARLSRGRRPSSFDAQLIVVRDALARTSRMFPSFLDAAQAAGWKTEEGALVGGSPVTIAVDTLQADGVSILEDKKSI
ncbi:DUF647-domain-containing protein [Cubamyces sp. BRFM 1775]|nr:DUF647-domain-containing protein [Cubamyces sp. BRFM 1775]